MMCPFTIIVDTREQMPFGFLDLRADARDGRAPLTVPTLTRGLPSGDYSIFGHEDRIAVERKSLADLFQTIGRGRRRFKRELERLNAMTVAEVIVESDWHTVLTAPPEHTKLLPKIVFRSIVAWKQQYRNVHWCFAGSRRLAEVITFRTLERYWRTVSAVAAAPQKKVPSASTD